MAETARQGKRKLEEESVKELGDGGGPNQNFVSFINKEGDGEDEYYDSDDELVMYADGRRMSLELQDEYNRQVEESEVGATLSTLLLLWSICLFMLVDLSFSISFDITLDLTLGACIGAPILPQRGNEGDPIFVDLSRRAIEIFNSQNATTYQYVKNVTVNTSYAAGMWCYITFQARDADDTIKTFQALAWWGIDGERDVRYCRFKKPSTH